MSADRKFIFLSDVKPMLAAVWNGGGRRALVLFGNILMVCMTLFLVLLLLTRYVLLPEVGRYKDDIEKITSHALGNQVTIASIDASWRGFNPRLDLRNLIIHDPAGAPALTLPSVQATLSWRSLLVAGLRFRNLTISSADLSIVRQADGKIYVAGLLVQSSADDSAGGLDWVLSQHEIVIKDGRIRWRDDVRSAPELALTDVNFVLRNQWQHHRMVVTATPPANLAAPLDIRADFTHPALTTRISDISRWKGTLFVDVKETDLAAWNAYIDYPIPLTSGTGSVRAWLDLNKARADNVTADLNLSNVSVTLGPGLAPLALRHVKGRIAAKETAGVHTEEGVPTFGASGHQVALNGFSLETADGLTLDVANMQESFEAATSRQPEKVSIEASDLDLQTLSSLATRLPLSPSQRQLLTDLSPSGRLRDFSLEWRGSYPDITSYRLRGAFNGLSVKPQPFRAAQRATATRPAIIARPALPGAQNVSGYIDTTDQSGKLTLASTDALLTWPDFFDQAVIPFDQLDMQAHWAIDQHETLQFKIDDMQFGLYGMRAKLSGTHTLPLSTRSMGHLDMQASVSSFDLTTIGRYLPADTEPELKHWLTGALVSGVVEDIGVKLTGNLEEFPFHGKTVSDTNSQFVVTGKFNNLVMNYDPGSFAKDGVTPEWPLLEKAKGTLKFDRTRLDIFAESGMTHGVPVSNVKAAVNDLLSHDPVLEIDGYAAGNMNKMLSYIEHSPVASWIEHFTSDTRATGNGKLHLKFQMPIERALETTAQGTVQLSNNDVDLLKDLPTIAGASGQVLFDETGFSLKDIKGRFLGGPVEVSGGSQNAHTIVVKAQGVARVDGVRQAFPQQELAHVLESIEGETAYNVGINVKGSLVDVTVDTSLRGLALNLPAPFTKAAGDSMPTRFVMRDLASSDPLLLKDEIELTVGKTLAARYARQKVTGKQDSWHVLNGGIGINQAAPRPDHGVTVSIDADKINMDEWNQFHSRAPASAGAASTLDDAGLNAYRANAVVARTSELTLMGRRLKQVVLGASREKNVWRANIASEQISGYASWSEPKQGDLGYVTARLTKLVIPKSESEHSGEILKTGDDTAVEIPELDIIADDFQLFDKKLGRLELKASTENNNVGQEWRIRKLSITNPDSTLRVAGNWIAAGVNSTSNLTYALDIQNAGNLAERFGIHGALRGGKGKLDGEVSWKGGPLAIDMNSLSGQIYMDVQQGQFLKIDSGGAKLLGVLSLQALPRRLTLDFRDVFSEGFAFDDIAGTATISKGVVTTDTLKMRSVTADVLMKGSASIVDETQNLLVTVTPDINLGTASVVAMTLNPLVGVGTFLTQMLLRGPINESMTFDYSITGSWSDPIVVKLEKDTQTKTQPAVSPAPLR